MKKGTKQKRKPKKVVKLKRTKITAELKMKILDLRSEGKTTTEIAKELNIAQSTVVNQLENLKKQYLGCFSENLSCVEEKTEVLLKDLPDSIVYEKVHAKLVENSIDPAVATKRLTKIHRELTKNKGGDIVVKEDELFELALSTVDGSELFLHGKSKESRLSNSVIMTEAASNLSDNNQKAKINQPDFKTTFPI